MPKMQPIDVRDMAIEEYARHNVHADLLPPGRLAAAGRHGAGIVRS